MSSYEEDKNKLLQNSEWVKSIKIIEEFNRLNDVTAFIKVTYKKDDKRTVEFYFKNVETIKKNNIVIFNFTDKDNNIIEIKDIDIINVNDKDFFIAAQGKLEPFKFR